MAYTKNYDPWTASDLVSTTVLDNFETIYTEISSYLAAHNHDALYQTKTEMEAAYWYAGNDGDSSGADADLLYDSGGNLHASAFAGLGVETGLIVLWYGSIGSIPSGWHLCNGSDGTVDLRNRFVVGAGAIYDPGDTGGATTFTADGTISVDGHALALAEIGDHDHDFTDTYGQAYGSGPNTGGWFDYPAVTAHRGSATHSGTTGTAGKSPADAHGHSTAEGTGITFDAVNSLPYYYALCYIQKLAP